MKSYLLHALILLLAFVSIAQTGRFTDDYFDSSLASCLAFASTFNNTCNSTTVSYDFQYLPGQNVTCTNPGMCPDTGKWNSSGCTFQRKLCVVCNISSYDGNVTMRVQTNGLPDSCFVQSNQMVAQVVDFTTYWGMDPDKFDPYYSNLSARTRYINPNASAYDQQALDNLMCTKQRSIDSLVPRLVNFTRVGYSQSLNHYWGVSVNGVLLGNSIDNQGIDPFYPTPYNGNNPQQTQEVWDWCLGQVDVRGAYVYNMPQVCRANINYRVLSQPVTAPVKDVMVEAWNKMPYRSVFGVAKDGRPIYTPYYSNGQVYNDCEIDMCNGIEIGGVYSYVTTFFHPYIMGCFGRGSNTEISQSCSKNPRKCVIQSVQYNYQRQKANLLTVGFIVISSLTGLGTF